MRSINLIASLAAAAALGVAGTADAATYCVGAPKDCPADHVDATFQGALNGAKSGAGNDVILLGKGVFERAEGYSYATATASNTVEIRGEGPSETILKTDDVKKSGNFSVLSLTVAGETDVEGLAVVAPDRTTHNEPVRGIDLHGPVQLDDVRVSEVGNAYHGPAEGIRTAGGWLNDVHVDLGNGPAAVRVHGGDEVRIHRSQLRGGIGVYAEHAGPVRVAGTRIHAANGIQNVLGAPVTVANVEIRLRTAYGIGLGVQAGKGEDAAIKASHVTIHGEGRADTHGVLALANDGRKALVEIDDSIVAGVAHGLARQTDDAGGDATISLKTVNYDSSGDVFGGLGKFPKQGVTNLAPGFADAAGGDLRLVRTSPLIDKGTDPTLVDVALYDVLGSWRKVGPARDLGAHEHQHAAPTAVIDVPEDVVSEIGTKLTAAKSTPNDAGDTIVAWSWSFGDGATSTAGPEAWHAWAAPGTYEVTLTVTDLDGKTHTAKRDVLVRVPDVPIERPCLDCGGSGSGGGTGGGGGGATT
ncbi:MAG: PKD domain-containing protein, partial [Actinomycetota bacterium]|nr:PKD domain-containing protein [Actinomycetota bacterium]